MSRIRHQIFLVGLMLAFTAASSAMAPLAAGQRLRGRAALRGQRLVRRTRRRLALVQAAVRRIRPAA